MSEQCPTKSVGWRASNGGTNAGQGPRLQDAMPDPTRAVDASTDVEALAIHPQGRVASDASAEPREGGSTHPAAERELPHRKSAKGPTP
jgi:hypothetical protein